SAEKNKIFFVLYLTHPHDLRHTFATLALQNGVDVKTVSSILGHFSAGFTLDTYAHVTTTAQREAAKKMDGVLGSRI
ncbi:MAG: tyrosine-type recombinase/integrase, partial [Acutalibacter sp.]